MSAITLTRITSKHTLSKRLELEGDQLTSTPAAELSQGQAEVQQIASLEALGVLLDSLGADEALTYGQPRRYSKALLLSLEKAAHYRGNKPVVTRTRAEFGWPDGPGVLLLDYDPQPGSEALSAEELVEALRQAVPELRTATLLCRPSASSCIHRTATGEELRGVRGQHLYAIVHQADQIPEIGRQILGRLWLTGHGFIRVGGAGQLLNRTIVDGAVWQPERLDFAAAECGQGLEQRMPRARLFPGELDDFLGETWIDTLEPLSAEEWSEVDRLEGEAKAAAADEAKAARAAWIEARVAEAAPDADQATRAALRDEFQRKLDGDALPRELVLHCQDGSTPTVADLIARPAEWHGKRFADPYEPDYRGDRRIALAVLTDCEDPHLYSHAHGGVRYPFISEAERLNAIRDQFYEWPPLPRGKKLSKRERFRPIPAHELAAQLDDGVTWFVKGVLPHGELAMIYGASGSGKSFFLLDLLAAIARGIDEWRGHRTGASRAVLYVCAEGQKGFRARMAAYRQHHQVDLATMPFHTITDRPHLLTEEDVELVIEAAITTGAWIVAIDTLAATTAGADENSGQDMGRMLDACARIHRRTGATVILVHHSGKDAARGSRGWSGLKAPLDTEIEVTREGDWRAAEIIKQKDGEEGEKFPFRLTPVLLGLDADGDPITSCAVEAGETAPAMKRPRGRWKNAVLDVVTDLAFTEGRVPEAEVIAEALERNPAEPGKADRRRECALRALRNLAEEGYLEIAEGMVIPQTHTIPQVGDVEMWQSSPADPQIPHTPIGVWNCGAGCGPEKREEVPHD